MRPGLAPGRIVIAVYRAQPPRIGDIVVVHYNGHELVKRVSHVRGEELYVLGDEPESSTDSRAFGWLPQTAVRGIVIWPRVKSPR